MSGLKFYMEDPALGLVFRLVKSEDDINRTMDFYFEQFLMDEPSTKAHGSYKDEASRHPGMVKQMDDILRDGISIMMIEKATGRVVGFRSSYRVDRATVTEPSTLEECTKILPFPHSHIIYACDTVCPAKHIMEKFPEVDSMFSMFAMGVHPDYRQKGLATRMVKMALQVAKLGGFQIATSVSTNNYTWHLFNKLDMTVWKSMAWTEFIDEQGEPLFKEIQSRGIAGHYMLL